MRPPETRIAFDDDELVVDNFAGGGGASIGMEQALGRSVDIAINHDPEALAMHRVNHPYAHHLCEDVWKVDIKMVVAGRRVGLAWFSPDCKHHSKAKGGKPVDKKIRGLAWVALRWAGLVRPRVIMLENVEEFQQWGPLVDGRPCARRKGMTFKSWVTQLRNLGYVVEWREMRASAYGAPTIRKRLFVVARCDGQAITWPAPTHGKGLLPVRTAAECIDWSIPCPSIFMEKKDSRKLGIIRPLADKTLRRIAHGVMRYLVNSAKPFIVNITHTGGHRTEPVDEPLRTITGAHRGEKAILVPSLVRTAHGDVTKKGKCRGKGQHPLTEPLQFGASIGSSAEEPVGTTTAGGGGKSAIVTAFLAGAGGPEYAAKPRSIDQPGHTQTTENHTVLVASSLAKLRGTNIGQPTDEPIHTVSAQGTHFAEVQTRLMPADAGQFPETAYKVAAFLIKYYGTDQDPKLEDPLHSVTTKDRFAVVVVTIRGADYVIVDIGMRMLTPRELFTAQGFPLSYVIDRGIRITDHGDSDDLFGVDIPLTKTAQIRMCGNSVSPPPARALVLAQFEPKEGIVAA